MARTVGSMSFASRCLAALSIALGGAVALCAPATAEPVDTGESAQSVIDGLKAEGYTVDINWLTGYNTEPLSVCTVENVNTPGDSVPGPGQFVTVYVDVSCPNHPDD
ncbi:MAG: hypothetical protein QOJ20_4777 [Mycobacterium sp.]|jgi:hypothetical protein|nr:hypothetical protein [Mycobacterium sp.]